ncbi:MAG: metal-dependent transcriptional regulator [Bacteroidales bacterium]
MSVSIENFVKIIYTQGKQNEAETRLSTLAGLLNITKAAATDMAKKLEAKNMVYYTKYKPLTLTPLGNELAIKVIRKHRLWESFLYKTLNLSLHEIHREAEHLEHLTSDFLVDKIEEYLDYPAADPHGDPIPKLDGKTENDGSQILLSAANAGFMYEITRLYSSEKDFFDFCSSNEIFIGSPVWVEKQYDSHKMTEIKVKQNKIVLHEDFTNIIYVRQLQNT